MSLPSQHHSFDISLAVQYGLERAILIHHFQHWIRINRKRGKNIREDRCWSYQTKADISAIFPYMTYDSVVHHLEVLVKGNESMGIEPVLLSKNFNKNPMDRTCWYAFIDEEKFGVSEGQIQKMFTKGENPQSMGENPQWMGENPHCNKDQILNPDAKTYIPKPAKSKKPKKEKPLPSAEASGLAKYFFEKIRETKPNFKHPDLTKWAYELDLMMIKDGIDFRRIKELIDWISTGTAKFAYFQSPKKLRERFDEQEMRKEASIKQKLINNNRTYAQCMQKRYPNQYRDLTFNSEMIINTKISEGILLDCPHEEFKHDLAKLFGVNNG